MLCNRVRLIHRAAVPPPPATPFLLCDSPVQSKEEEQQTSWLAWRPLDFEMLLVLSQNCGSRASLLLGKAAALVWDQGMLLYT